tara:strand:+ start:1610 stop:3523 length:1914 start_codon:yes stop_codon:yes gene_type:complete
MAFNIDQIIKKTEANQYSKRIKLLKNEKGFDTSNIEAVVKEVTNNIFKENCRSLVIYGEPQSGKTETMIALTAKLLDEGKKHILLLVTDNVKLRDQNLGIFAKSRINPTPKDNLDFLREVKENNLNISKVPFIVFCKKNASELRNLIRDTRLAELDDLIIIDDEADYATPNSKVNKRDNSNEAKELRSVINGLIKEIMNRNGIWIGVTATPGRLDLNNTYANETNRWVYLPPHTKYYGQYHFFPASFRKEHKKAFHYNVTFLGESGDDPSYIKKAVYKFLVTVAKKNIEKKQKNLPEENYSMIVHTSTGKEGHKNDFRVVNENIFKHLIEETNKYSKVLEEIYNTANDKFNNEKLSAEIVKYIWENKQQYRPVIMNSDKDMKSQNFDAGTDPQTPFTIIFGGNIISRGLTFHGLISMFFSRDSKHKLDSGTYIQRARMFGNREHLFKDFELTIPAKLYTDWWQVFKEHRESLATVNNFDHPLWFSSKRTKTTQPSSIDKANVIEQSGEIYFEKFKLSEEIKDLYSSGLKKNKLHMIKKLYKILGDKVFLKPFYEEISNDKDAEKDDNIYIQNIRPIDNDKYKIPGEIRRSRGGHIDGHNSGAEYWFAMFMSEETNEARLFYRSYFNRKIISHIRTNN